MNRRAGAPPTPERREAYALVYLGALLGTALVLSLLAVYNPGTGWLRTGMVLLAVGLAMWLPGSLAALAAVLLALASAYLRGGLDNGVLRGDSLLALPGLALVAFLAGALRGQIEALARAGAPPPAQLLAPATPAGPPIVVQPEPYETSAAAEVSPRLLLPGRRALPPGFAASFAADLLRLQPGLMDARALIRSSRRMGQEASAASAP